MIAFDATFLVDYLTGEDETKAFLDTYGDKPLFAPALGLFEVYRGAARSGGPAQLERAVTALNWVEPLPLTEPAAQEAAIIEAELLNEGNPVNLGDVLIAGICRQAGARLVTRDADFDNIDGLDVISY